MGNTDVFDGDASVFAEVPKMMANKRSRDERFILDPLGELVDGNVYVPETT